MKKRVGFNARFVPTGKLFDAVIEIDESRFAFGRELSNGKSSESENVNVSYNNQFRF